MGTLTGDMTRLTHEIEHLRRARHTLNQQLSRSARNLSGEVSEMASGFRRTQAAMAEKTKAACEAFLADVRTSVAGVKQTVAGMRQDFVEDLAGARSAWSGARPKGSTRSAAAAARKPRRKVGSRK